jgi:FtsH-binding integral membrane protein
MNKNTASYVIDILSLLVFTTLTIVALVMHEITIFYLIYIFWWEECIKTIFTWLNYYFRKNEIKDPKTYKIEYRARFFMLFIYLVFIIVCFGLIMDWSSKDIISTNFEIFLFQNLYFNISLISFIGRELYVFSNKKNANQSTSAFSSGTLTLHISIILGVLLWAVATKKLGSLPLALESYSTILAITPFLIIKFLFDCLAIKARRKEMK